MEIEDCDMNIIDKINLWNKQRKCSHKNFKSIASTTVYIDNTKRFPKHRTYIRECLDCGLLYKSDSIYTYRTENTYSIFPSNQIRRLRKKERESLGR